ncbi:MAG: methyltransferase [Actinophytocola sp.]|uniref:methyltransferase n=1 Tax=Actinophytocola sp. TaxID=1872138 RepID=UPI003C745345
MTGNVTDPDRTVIDLITGTWRAQALSAAAELRLADHVADGHRTLPQLVRRTGVAADPMLRLMRLLVALEVFDGDADGYGLTAISHRLRTDVPGSMNALCRLYGREFHKAWGSLPAALRTGKSGFATAFGRSIHDYLATVPDAGERFQAAMAAGSTFFAEVPSAVDLSDAKVVVDVAGGTGQLLAAVLDAYPRLHGILVEREGMVPLAEAELGKRFPADRFDVVAEDIFTGLPAHADVYLLSRVLQDWPDAQCLRLLSNCRDAMTGHAARLLIVERVVADSGGDLLPLLWDLHLFVAAGGGERTERQYRDLFRAANLRWEGTRDLALETTLLIASPEPETDRTERQLLEGDSDGSPPRRSL